MKKQTNLFAFSAALLCGLAVASCGGQSSSHATGLTSESSHATGLTSDSSHATGLTSETSHDTGLTSESREDWEERAELAMANFAAKLAEGNYTIACQDRLTTSVFGQNLVWFDYGPNLGHDYAGMSVGNETFQSRVDMGTIQQVMFVDKGRAIDVAKNLLPSLWFDSEAIGKDIWDLFDRTEPNDGKLHFLASEGDYTVRDSLGSWYAVDSLAVRGISHIAMEFDKVDVTQAILTARFNDGTSPQLKDISVTITLGQAQDNAAAEEWMNNPNRPMPADIKDAGKWSGNPLGVIDTMLMLRSADEAMAYVPFMDFGSYAVWTNGVQCVQDQYGLIRDYHGTIRNVEDYKEKLIQENFTLITTPAGDPVYRKLLRAKDKQACYVNIEVDYDEGFCLKIYPTYDTDKFNTRGEFNDMIAKAGFPAFADTEAVYNWFGEDQSFAQIENWSYFYDYSLYTVLNLKTNNLTAASAYLEAYGKALEDLGFKRGSASEIDTWTYLDADKEMIFKFTPDQMGNIKVLVKRDNYASSATMKTLVEAAGYPTVDLTSAKLVVTQDHQKFEHYYESFDCSLAYRNTFYFDTNDQAKQFLADYMAALRADGFAPLPSTDYYAKGDLLFKPNEAQGGICGLYFFVRDSK